MRPARPVVPKLDLAFLNNQPRRKTMQPKQIKNLDEEDQSKEHPNPNAGLNPQKPIRVDSSEMNLTASHVFSDPSFSKQQPIHQARSPSLPPPNARMPIRQNSLKHETLIFKSYQEPGQDTFLTPPPLRPTVNKYLPATNNRLAEYDGHVFEEKKPLKFGILPGLFQLCSAAYLILGLQVLLLLTYISSNIEIRKPMTDDLIQVKWLLAQWNSTYLTDLEVKPIPTTGTEEVCPSGWSPVPGVNLPNQEASCNCLKGLDSSELTNLRGGLSDAELASFARSSIYVGEPCSSDIFNRQAAALEAETASWATPVQFSSRHCVQEPASSEGVLAFTDSSNHLLALCGKHSPLPLINTTSCEGADCPLESANFEGTELVVERTKTPSTSLALSLEVPCYDNTQKSGCAYNPIGNSFNDAEFKEVGTGFLTNHSPSPFASLMSPSAVLAAKAASQFQCPVRGYSFLIHKSTTMQEAFASFAELFDLDEAIQSHLQGQDFFLWQWLDKLDNHQIYFSLSVSVLGVLGFFTSYCVKCGKNEEAARFKIMGSSVGFYWTYIIATLALLASLYHFRRPLVSEKVILRKASALKECFPANDYAYLELLNMEEEYLSAVSDHLGLLEIQIYTLITLSMAGLFVVLLIMCHYKGCPILCHIWNVEEFMEELDVEVVSCMADKVKMAAQTRSMTLSYKKKLPSQEQQMQTTNLTQANLLQKISEEEGVVVTSEFSDLKANRLAMLDSPEMPIDTQIVLIKNSSVPSKKTESRASPRFPELSQVHGEQDESDDSDEESEEEQVEEKKHLEEKAEDSSLESGSPVVTKIKEDIEESIREDSKIVVHVSQEESALDGEQIEMVFQGSEAATPIQTSVRKPFPAPELAVAPEDILDSRASVDQQAELILSAKSQTEAQKSRRWRLATNRRKLRDGAALGVRPRMKLSLYLASDE